MCTTLVRTNERRLPLVAQVLRSTVGRRAMHEAGRTMRIVHRGRREGHRASIQELKLGNIGKTSRALLERHFNFLGHAWGRPLQPHELALKKYT